VNPQPINPFDTPPLTPTPDNSQPVQPIAPSVMQPITPVAPIAGSNIPVNPNGTAKKSKVGLIIGLVIGGLTLIGGSLTLLVLLMGGGPSQQDYSDAIGKLNNVTRIYNDMGSSVGSFSSFDTETEIANGIDSVTTKQADLNSALDTLSGARVIKKDKQAKELFSKVTDRREKFNEYIGITLEYANLLLSSK
jgi:hypothetical protein